MKSNMRHFLMVITGLLVIFSFACKKNKCRDGFVSQDGDCICPVGKFEGKGMCRELKPNEYYASLGHCLCTDTVFLEIVERNDKDISFKFDLGWGYEITGCGLIKLPDGDSLYTELGSFTGELGCSIKGRAASTQIFGKFIENDSKIRVTLKYMAFPYFEEELGRCEFTFHK